MLGCGGGSQVENTGGTAGTGGSGGQGGATTSSSVGASSTKFRIAWGEAGPESEGWCPWTAGTINLR